MKIEDRIIKGLDNFWQTSLSIIKIGLQSKWQTELPEVFSNPDELLILANGPSLNETVKEHSDFVKSKTLMAVNFAATSPMFEQLKPELYLIADPLFWIVPEKREQLFGGLAQKTTWPMTFFVPARALKDKSWQSLLLPNKNIKICIYNTTPVEGYSWFCNHVFHTGLGMPRPHNVLIPAISIGLRMAFKKIYLAGADHSWLPEIRVTDDNIVLMNQKHFYDLKDSKADIILQEDLKSERLHTTLHHMSVAFKAYFILDAFARKRDEEVINITPGSYIDAFKRIKL